MQFKNKTCNVFDLYINDLQKACTQLYFYKKSYFLMHSKNYYSTFLHKIED